MYRVNEDNSIYATRGDIVFINVSAEDNGKPYTFKAGDVLRIKVYGKKNCEDVSLQKDFPITSATQTVELFLGEEDTKIGDVISKPKDYWYEVELNPYNNPQTIIGYDEDGAKLFKLFPEGADIPEYVPDPDDFPVIDDELDMTSDRPVKNQVIARAFANLQDGYQKTHEAVAALHLTPQMFGAIGDGVSDDTEAFQAAIESSGDVYIPAGTYLISSALTISDLTHFHGAGQGETVIKFTGNGYLFDVGTGYTNSAIIEGIRFEGGSNSFLRCSKGAWGGKAIIRNVTIVGFNNEVFRFESCFNPVVEHCVIITDGKIVLTTYDGTVTETNFTNCACFVNVYISKYSENRISTVFDMTNARYTTFHKCQLENAELLVSAKNKTNGVDFYSCWFENLTSIYRKDSTSKAPSACDCNYVRVDSYNADENTIDYISGRGLLLQKSTGNSGLKTALNNSVVLEEANIYNKGDGFSDYTPIYRITTTETDFNQSLNKRTIYKTSVNSAEFNLQSILRYSGADCVFNVVARILYSDDSSKIIETKVLCLNGVFYICDIDTLKLTRWESSVSSTATETVTCTSGVLKLESSVKMSKCWIMVEFNFN